MPARVHYKYIMDIAYEQTTILTTEHILQPINTSDSSGQLNVFDHYCDTFGMYCT